MRKREETLPKTTSRRFSSSHLKNTKDSSNFLTRYVQPNLLVPFCNYPGAPPSLHTTYLTSHRSHRSRMDHLLHTIFKINNNIKVYSHTRNSFIIKQAKGFKTSNVTRCMSYKPSNTLEYIIFGLNTYKTWNKDSNTIRGKFMSCPWIYEDSSKHHFQPLETYPSSTI